MPIEWSGSAPELLLALDGRSGDPLHSHDLARILRRGQAMTTAPGVPARARERPVAHRRIAVLVGVLFMSFTVAFFIGNSLIHSMSSA